MYESGKPMRPGLTYFTISPSGHRIELTTETGTVAVSGTTTWLNYISDPSRAVVMYNTRHQSANLLIDHAGYGETGSGTMVTHGTFDHNCSGVLVAKLFSDDAHAYPITSRGAATSDLVPWQWRCVCGGMMAEGAHGCLACQNR